MAWVVAKDDEFWSSPRDPMDVFARFQRICPAIQRFTTIHSGGHSVTTTQGQSELSEFVLDFVRSFD